MKKTLGDLERQIGYRNVTSSCDFVLNTMLVEPSCHAQQMSFIGSCEVVKHLGCEMLSVGRVAWCADGKRNLFNFLIIIFSLPKETVGRVRAVLIEMLTNDDKKNDDKEQDDKENDDKEDDDQKNNNT